MDGLSSHMSFCGSNSFISGLVSKSEGGERDDDTHVVNHAGRGDLPKMQQGTSSEQGTACREDRGRTKIMSFVEVSRGRKVPLGVGAKLAASRA